MELRNDHNVYILGAGFSRDRGYPLMADFLNCMRDAHPWLEVEGRDREAKAIQNILEFRLKAASAGYRVTSDLENIEELFSLAAATPGGTKLMADVRLAIAATLDFCHRKAEAPKINIECIPEKLRCPYEESQYSMSSSLNKKILSVDRYDALVLQMCGLLNLEETKGQSTIITFNYDTLVEDALSNSNMPWTYGFDHGGRYVSHSSFKPPINKTFQPIPVYKLHGSLNWAYVTGKGKGFTVYGKYSDVLSDGAIPELVPPTWRKNFDNKVSEVWDNSVKALQTATRIIIVGFSIPETDMHFKHLIAAGLQDNISLREINFVSPDQNLSERAKKIFRDPSLCQFYNQTAFSMSVSTGNEGSLCHMGRPSGLI